MAKLIEAGNIHVCDNQDADGADPTPTMVPMALLIQFDSIDEINQAIEQGKCEFKWAWDVNSEAAK